LRTLRPRQRRLYGSEIERERFRILRLRSLVIMEKSLLSRISLDKRNLISGAPSQLEIFQSLFINREYPTRCSIFGGHVCYCGAVGQGEFAEAGAVEFYELAHYSVLAE